MASKFAEFIQTNKIDPRRIVTSSRQLERMRREDRQIRLQKRQIKKAEGAGEKPTEERRSGRTVTTQLITKAQVGKPISGAAKTRLLRAVNRLLEQKKKDAVDLRALF